MKRSIILIAGISAMLFGACKEEAEKPKVIYDSAKSKPAAARKADTTQIEIADLPIAINGTGYLVHPVGDLRVYSGSGAKYNSSGSEDVSYTISNYNEFEITGYLRNLKFQKTGTDSLTVLTDKPIMIQTATYLQEVAQKLKQNLLVYTLSDMDTNKDGRIDSSDIKTLYISSVGGEGFKKLSADFEELIDWKLIPESNRLYFRTIEDTNKNGEFDKSDVLHYHYADLSTKEFKVSQYNPLK